MHGPVKAGEMHDRTLFCGGTLDHKTMKERRDNWDNASLYFRLPAGKKAIGDSGYKGIPEKVTITLDGHSKRAKDFINRAKARQESYNWRLKTYRVLRSPFRHGKTTAKKLAMHKMCAEAVSVMVQYDLKHNPIMQLTGKIKAE